ncbi:unnamed protein product [Ranitomeya imitator]|uniref:GIY-YIG homing endonuclease n=1 Tax=Ranitomeya imitator TaxID=111125 RepID=A0ABN9LNW0_9NEOB|nr:unnamed protein product [Ranitomeya imitator]
MLSNCLPRIKEFREPPLFSYRRGKNIKDYVVKSDIGPFKNPCQTTITGVSQKGFHYQTPGHKEYTIKQFLTCNSDHVICLLECPCKLWYVGETTCELKVRMNNHRHSIRKKRLDLPVSKHFVELKHTEKDLKFRIIDKIPIQRRGGEQSMPSKKTRT